MKRAIALLLLPFVLAACGGNGSSSPSVPSGVKILDIPATLPNPQVTDLSLDASTVAGIADNHAFTWSYGGGFSDLGAPPAGTLANVVVSGDGSTVAGTAVSSGTFRQAVSGSVGTSLSALDAIDSSATKISNNGRSIGGYRYPSTPANQVGVNYYNPGIVVTTYPQIDMDANGALWYFNGATGQIFKWGTTTPIAQVTAPGTAVPFQVSGDGSTILYQTSGAMHFIKIATAAVTDVSIPAGFTATNPSLSYDGTSVVFPEGIYSGSTFLSVSQWLSNAGLAEPLTGWTNLSAIRLSKDGRSLLGKGTNPSSQTQYWIARFDLAQAQ